MNIQALRDPSPTNESFRCVEDFLDWAERQPARYELVDGVPRLLPWVKLNHARIVTNFLTALTTRIDRGALEVTAGDFAIQVGEKSVRFADVMVFPAGKAGGVRTVSDAVLLVEVLSESTASVDFGAKLQEYQRLDHLRHYVIVDQDVVRVWHWTREKDGGWPATPSVVADDVSLTLPVLGLHLPLADLYRGVN